MATLRFTLGQVNITDYLLLVLREVESPLAEVYTELLDPPHSSTRIMIVPDLNSVNHYVDWYRSNSDGDKLSLLHSTEVDLGKAEDIAFSVVEFLVDGDGEKDPASGTDEYNDANLAGISNYSVFKPGYGVLSWGRDIEALSGGGFRLLDMVFESGELYTLFVFKMVNVPTAGTSGKPFFTGIEVITDNTSFDATHYDKLLFINGSGILTIDIEDINVIPEGKIFGVNTHGGTQRYTVIQLPELAYCWIGGTQRNVIYLGRGEEAAFYKKGDTLYILYWHGDHLRIGEKVFADGIPPLNSLPETGGWKNMDDYPRLYEWYVNELPMGELGDISELFAGEPTAYERTKWCIDYANNRFWVPDQKDYYLRNSDGSRKPGHVQLPQVGQFYIRGDKFKKSGTGADLVALKNINDANLGQLDVIANSGKENRVLNAATNVYRII